jgi:hypothetical protein
MKPGGSGFVDLRDIDVLRSRFEAGWHVHRDFELFEINTRVFTILRTIDSQHSEVFIRPAL